MAGRLRGLDPDEWGDEVRAALVPTLAPVAALEGRDAAEQRSRPLEILTVMAHDAALLRPFLAWASALVFNGVLSRREHELLALRTASNWGSAFEWAHHVVYGRTAGLTNEEIAQVAQGPRAPGWAPGDATLLQAADELCGAGSVNDATWDALAARLPAAALVEVPWVVGQYTMLSMIANAAGVGTEAGDDALPSARTSPARPST